MLQVHPNVRMHLQPMDAQDYQKFLDYAVGNYAEEKVRAGNYSPDDAMLLAEREYQELLPAAQDTRNNYLLSIIDEDQQKKVGFVWLTLEQTGILRYLTVVNILIYSEFRRRGYATRTFHLVEEKARELGLERVKLHVFGHNDAARALYKKLGYREANVHMAKDLV
jgi:RimJ/RimL family protein N-acetyltransferase